MAVGRQLHTESPASRDRRARPPPAPRPAGRQPAHPAGAGTGGRPGRWGTPLPEGRARGVACSSFLESHSAQVVEISLDRRNRVRLEKVTFALDCGITVNPDLVRAQVEGGLIWALGAAAWDEVVLGDGGEIITKNFDRYPVMRMKSVPKIDVLLIQSGESPTGVGEVSVPTAAPALVNAIAAGENCAPLAEELSPGELRVLRFLPTNLSRPEIASELSVSVNTVSTHLRKIYAKLGAGHPRRRPPWLLAGRSPQRRPTTGRTAGAPGP